MAPKITPPGAKVREQHQWNNTDRQQNVRNQNKKINVSHSTDSTKSRGITGHMVDHVHGQEHR
jgi:hypothetical protein